MLSQYLHETRTNPRFGEKVHFFFTVEMSEGANEEFRDQLGGKNAQPIVKRLQCLLAQLDYAKKQRSKAIRFYLEIHGGPCRLTFCDVRHASVAKGFVEKILTKTTDDALQKSLAHIVFETAYSYITLQNFPVHHAALAQNPVAILEALGDLQGSLEKFNEPEVKEEKQLYAQASIRFQRTCQTVLEKVKAVRGEILDPIHRKQLQTILSLSATAENIVKKIYEMKDLDCALQSICEAHSFEEQCKECQTLCAAMEAGKPQATYQWLPTPLKIAAFLGNKSIVKCLLQHGAQGINLESNTGTDAAQIAENAGHNEVAKLIREFDYRQVDTKGFSPIHYAVLRGDAEGVSYLAQKLDINIPNPTNGQTSLQMAADRGNSEMVQRLLGCGAMADQIPKANELARIKGFDKVCTVLEEHTTAIKSKLTL